MRRALLIALAAGLWVWSWLGAAEQLMVGYITVTADPGSRLPAGAALFSYTNNAGVLVCEAGVGASIPMRTSRIFVDEAGTRTAIALVNPNTVAASATLILRDAAGREVRRTPLALSARQHTARFVQELFTGLTGGFTGTLTIDSDQPLAAITLRETTNSRGEPLSSTLPVADLSLPATTETSTFPQIAAGGGYSTQIVLINRVPQRIQGRVRFTASDGAPLTLRSGSSNAADLPYQIDGDGALRVTLTSDTGLSVGYASVVPDAGSAAPAGTAIFQTSADGALTTEAGVGAAPLTTLSRLFVDTVGTQTGVAVANPGSATADLTFTLTDSAGASPTSVTRSLRPGGHMAIFADQLFTALPSGFTGLMEIRSNTPVAPVTLKLSTNALGNLVLTTLPVADLTRIDSATQSVFAHAGLGLGFSTRLVFISRDTARTANGSIQLSQSDGTPMVVTLAGQSGSQFSYQLPQGGGRMYSPGVSSTPVGSITLIDPQTNAPASEVVVEEGGTARASVQIVDTQGQVRTDIVPSFTSANPAVATIDATGTVRGLSAGFATLTISASGFISSATIAVVRLSTGTTAFSPTSVVQDLARRLYLVSSQDHAVYLAQDLALAPVLYAGTVRTPGLRNAARLQSQFNAPGFVVFNQAEGSLYVSDGANHVIRRVRPGSNGVVETLAGTGTPGSQDGTLLTSGFNNPQGIALDNLGNLWVADSGNHTIRRIQLLSGRVETIAGRAGTPGLADGSGSSATFRSPAGLAIETESTAEQLDRNRRGDPPPPVRVVVADSGNGVIRRVSENGLVETLQSNTIAIRGVALESSDRRKLTAPARFVAPAGIDVDPFGIIYVTEPSRGALRALLKTGDVVPVVQGGILRNPRGVLVAEGGRVVVADTAGTVRRVEYGPPQITSITPNRVSSLGGESVTVRGANFAPETMVVVGGVLARNIVVAGSQSITFTTPAAPSGLGTLTLQNRGGLAERPLLIDRVPFTTLPPGTITTYAGGRTYAGDGAQATQASVDSSGVALDGAGNLYLSDEDNHRIRQVNARTGVILTIAGSGQIGWAGDNGPALTARMYGPAGLAVDRAGNLFVAEANNHVIRKITQAGIISTVVGNGASNRTAEGLPGTATAVFGPRGVAVDSAGNVFYADTEHHVIRRLSTDGIVNTVAGNWNAGYSGDNGPATLASLNHPVSIALDPDGNLLIADTNNFRLRRVDVRTRVITTIAGTGTEGHSGDGGPASRASLQAVIGVSVDASGTIFSASPLAIRRIDEVSGIITTVAGMGSVIGPAGNDGPATRTVLEWATSVTADAAGNLYFGESRFSWIRRVGARTGTVVAVAGNGLPKASGDGLPAGAVELNAPNTVRFDPDGNLVIADAYYVRRVDQRTGSVSAVMGDGTPGGTTVGRAATGNPLSSARGLAWDAAGNLFVSSAASVFRIDASSGLVTIAAGQGSAPGFSGDGGPATRANLNYNQGLTVDRNGSLVIADTLNHRIRRVDAGSGIITTVAGSGPVGSGMGSFSGDGGPATSARFNDPTAVGFDAAGNMYIADMANSRIRFIHAVTGLISTVAGGDPAGRPLGDGGPATRALILGAGGFTFDSQGNLYIGDVDGQRVRRVSAATGIITTIAGNGQIGFAGDNGPATRAQMASPTSLAFDRDGNLFVAETRNHRIRVIRGPIP